MGFAEIRQQMLHKPILAALFLVCLPSLALADNEKIDPATYLCAEFISSEAALGGQPPLFEGLQIDGYASAALDMDVASSDTISILLGQAFLWCEKRPSDTVLSIWQRVRGISAVPQGNWHAKTATCADYAMNQEDASGFIIWLDAYNRKAQNTTRSILNTDEDLQAFIDACLLSPGRTMLEVLRENAR